MLKTFKTYPKGKGVILPLYKDSVHLIRKFSSKQLTNKVAIIGTGPSAFYTAHSLLRYEPNLQITFFEKLPTPFGLSRYGVAPDHAEVKSCEEILEELSRKIENVKILTNVEIGKDISIKELSSSFHSIVFAYGTAEEVQLNVPGEREGHSNGLVFTSREFVDWYNGNPLWDQKKRVDLSQVEDVTIIGNGNVAMDIARLLLSPVEHLTATDIMCRAVVGLKKSNVKRVNIVARRGLLESAFATKELRELIQLEQYGVKFEGVKGQDLTKIQVLAKKAERVLKRKIETISNSLKPLNERKLKYQVSENFEKFWNLQYLKSPTGFQFKDNDSKIQIEFTENEIEPSGKVINTQNKHTQTTDLVITSLGYKSTPLEDFQDNLISFNKGTITTNGSYKIQSCVTNEVIKGLYATGWLTKESKGPILNQVGSGMSLAQIIIDDLKSGVSLNPTDELQGLDKYSDWNDWKKLDQFEKDVGKKLGKLRFKLQDLQIMKKVVETVSEEKLETLKKEIVEKFK